MAEPNLAVVHGEEALECSACCRVIVICQCCCGGHGLSSCPSCHGRRFRKLVTNNNNVPEPMKLLDHKCKFSINGCDVLMNIGEIISHEKKCPSRIITCPYVGCRKEVTLKMFEEEHATSDCIEDWDDDDDPCFWNDLWKWPYNLNDWNPDNYGYGWSEVNLKEDRTWKLARFYVCDQAFYIFMHYMASKQLFFHCVILPDNAESASKYNVKMYLGPDETSVRQRRKLAYEGPVLSIDELPDLNSSIAPSKYWIVPLEDMQTFIGEGPGLRQIPFTVSVKKFSTMPIYNIQAV